MSSRAAEINEVNARLADRLRRELDEARERLEAADGVLAEAQAERDSALDDVRRISQRLNQAEADAKRVPLYAHSTDAAGRTV
jgi:flagellar motility protein MotE (MotC chaperone)